jgi:hypothetical protein
MLHLRIVNACREMDRLLATPLSTVYQSTIRPHDPLTRLILHLRIVIACREMGRLLATPLYTEYQSTIRLHTPPDKAYSPS